MSDPRDSREWRQAVADMAVRVYHSEMSGHRPADTGWPWEHELYRARLSPPDQRLLWDDIMAARDALDVPEPAVKVTRTRGRPKGPTFDRPALLAEYRRVRKALGRRPTQAEFCESARPRIGVRTLRDNLTAAGLDWPPE